MILEFPNGSGVHRPLGSMIRGVTEGYVRPVMAKFGEEDYKKYDTLTATGREIIREWFYSELVVCLQRGGQIEFWKNGYKFVVRLQ